MNKIKEQIISLLIDHVRIIYDVISDMGVYYTYWSEDYDKNEDNLEKKKNKMLLSEEDADGVKIHLIQEFSEAGAQGLGGYIGLVLKMDNVINSALEFVDILANIDYRISDDIKKKYHKLINNIIEMAGVLKTTIKSLRDKPGIVFKNTTKIHEIENNVDITFREFLNYLYNTRDLEIRMLLRIRDSIVILENLADRIHDIGDEIRVLLYQ
jgi:uncharacterized protein Yka (UPF0111/DUF47 family)